jgi:hypothetical protein
MERTAIAGSPRSTRALSACDEDQEQQDHLRPAPSHTANHIDRAYNAMTKIGLTNSAKPICLNVPQVVPLARN